MTRFWNILFPKIKNYKLYSYLSSLRPILQLVWELSVKISSVELLTDKQTQNAPNYLHPKVQPE